VLCDFHGCTNKADILSRHSELMGNDGLSKWDVYVNVCDEHFDDLILPKKQQQEEEEEED